MFHSFFLLIYFFGLLWGMLIVKAFLSTQNLFLPTYRPIPSSWFSHIASIFCEEKFLFSHLHPHHYKPIRAHVPTYKSTCPIQTNTVAILTKQEPSKRSWGRHGAVIAVTLQKCQTTLYIYAGGPSAIHSLQQSYVLWQGQRPSPCGQHNCCCSVLWVVVHDMSLPVLLWLFFVFLLFLFWILRRNYSCRNLNLYSIKDKCLSLPH